MHPQTDLYREVGDLLSSARDHPRRSPEAHRPGPEHTVLLEFVATTPECYPVVRALRMHPGRGPAKEAYRRAVLTALTRNPNLDTPTLMDLVGEDLLHREVVEGVVAHPSCTREVLALLHAAEADLLVVDETVREVLYRADPDLARPARALEQVGWGRWEKLAGAALFLADHPSETTEIFLGLTERWSGTTLEALEAAVRLTGSSGA